MQPDGREVLGKVADKRPLSSSHRRLLRVLAALSAFVFTVVLVQTVFGLTAQAFGLRLVYLTTSLALLLFVERVLSKS